MKNPRITQEEVGIIKDAQAGNILAFNKLFYKYKTFVEKLLLRYIKDIDEAKDITNIVFLKLPINDTNNTQNSLLLSLYLPIHKIITIPIKNQNKAIFKLF